MGVGPAASTWHSFHSLGCHRPTGHSEKPASLALHLLCPTVGPCGHPPGGGGAAKAHLILSPDPSSQSWALQPRHGASFPLEVIETALCVTQPCGNRCRGAQETTAGRLPTCSSPAENWLDAVVLAPLLSPSLRLVAPQVHHAGRPQAGNRCAPAPRHCHQRRVLAVGRHQVPEERGVPGRYRVCEPAGKRSQRTHAGAPRVHPLPLAVGSGVPLVSRPAPCGPLAPRCGPLPSLHPPSACFGFVTVRRLCECSVGSL